MIATRKHAVRESSAPFRGPDFHASTSATELRDAMARIAVDHEVDAPGRLDGLATGALLGGVHLAYVRYGGPTRVIAHPTGEQVCWTIPLGPMGVGTGHTRPVRQTRAFALASDDTTTMVPNPQVGAVVVTTTTGRLTEQLHEMTGGHETPVEVRTGPSQWDRGLINHAWRHAAAVLAVAPEVPRHLARSLEESLVTALLLELPHQHHEALLDDPPLTRSASAEHARRATHWAREHLDQPFTLGEWAAGVGLSVRHLQKCFRQELDTAPKQYLLGLRLERAHVLLGAPGEGRSVTSIAAEAGFAHLGRFAAAYRQRYGVPPSFTFRSTT